VRVAPPPVDVPSPLAGEGSEDGAANSLGEGWLRTESRLSMERTPHPAIAEASLQRSQERTPKAAYATFSHKGRREEKRSSP
jgi:hypothetical protein